MIQRIKYNTSLKTILTVVAAFALMSCKEPAEKVEIKDSVITDTTVIATDEQKSEQTAAIDSKPQWIYYKAVPITAEGSSSTFNCNDAKYSALNIKFAGDSVYIGNKYTDDVYRTNIKAKSFFDKQYMYDFYKQMLQKEFGLKLEDTFESVRNKKAQQKESPLDAYFTDAFFIKDYMFAESGGCVYVYRKNPAYKSGSTTTSSQKVSAQSNVFVTLPFDSKAYYESCVYPGNKQDCAQKYPVQPFKNDALSKSVESAFQKEGLEYFKVANTDVQLYVVHFQGDDADEYGLLSLKNNKVIASKIIGSSGGDKTIDFVLDSNKQVSLFKRGTGSKRVPFEKYEITTQGKFVKK